MTVPTTGARYHFPCQRWLARDRGDRKLVVEFTPSSVQEFGMFVCDLFVIYQQYLNLIAFRALVNLLIFYVFFSFSVCLFVR